MIPVPGAMESQPSADNLAGIDRPAPSHKRQMPFLPRDFRQETRRLICTACLNGLVSPIPSGQFPDFLKCILVEKEKRCQSIEMLDN